MTVEVQVKLVMAWPEGCLLSPVFPPAPPLTGTQGLPSVAAPQAGITSMRLPRGLELERPDLCGTHLS